MGGSDRAGRHVDRQGQQGRQIVRQNFDRSTGQVEMSTGRFDMSTGWVDVVSTGRRVDMSTGRRVDSPEVEFTRDQKKDDDGDGDEDAEITDVERMALQQGAVIEFRRGVTVYSL